jgi:hypothetical protein
MTVTITAMTASEYAASRCAVTCSSRTGALPIKPSTFHFDARAPQDGAIPNVIQGPIAFIHDGRRLTVTALSVPGTDRPDAMATPET